MLGGDRERVPEPERVELDRARLVDPLGLVRDEHHRRPARFPAERFGEFLVRGSQPGARVHHEDDEVAPGRRALGEGPDLAGEGRGVRRPRPAGVVEAEGDAAPFDRLQPAVAGGAGPGVDDGGAAADDAVEEGGLADVRPPEERRGFQASRGRGRGRAGRFVIRH